MNDMPGLLPAIIIVALFLVIWAPLYVRQRRRTISVKADIEQAKEMQQTHNSEYMAEIKRLASATERQAIGIERVAAALERMGPASSATME